MKHKALITFTLVILVVLSVFSLAIGSIDASSAPVLSVVLSGTTSTNIIPAQAVGTTFKVDVRVDNVASVSAGVNGISYNLTWDPTVLECTAQKDNSWLPSQQAIGDIPANNSIGLVIIGQIAFNSKNASASTIIPSVSATFTFQVLSSGSCAIGLGLSSIGVPFLYYPNGNGGSSPVVGTTTVNATYGVSANLLPHGPIAGFTPADGSTLLSGTQVALNASSSQPGYDAQTCNITNYAWSVEYLNGTTFTSLTGEYPSFNASVNGAFLIVLIVTANDTNPSPNPSYTSTNSVSAIINVVSSLQSVNIKIFTDNGVGSQVNGTVYGPLQLLQVYATISSYSVSIADESVAFSMQNNNGSTIAIRQGITNQTGVASASFRLPVIDPATPQYQFGAWSITVSVNTLGATVSSVTNFTFGYQSGIQNVTIPTIIQTSQTLPVKLTVNNQYLSAQWTQLSITVFDQADVPIASQIITTPQQTQNITIIDSAITIPSWAFPGQATLCLCLLSNSTNSQLIPIAPETTATFQIQP